MLTTERSRTQCANTPPRIYEVWITWINDSRPYVKGARWLPRATSRFDGENGLDFHRYLVRRRAHAARGGGVAPRLAEHLDEHVGAAVDDLGMVLEVRHGVDHAEHLEDCLDPVERAQRLAGGREQLQPDGA